MTTTATHHTPLRSAVERALLKHKEFPAAFPSVAHLDPNGFERWTLRTPERWVDPNSLPRDEQTGMVRVGGDVIMPWRYFTAIWAAAIEPSPSSSFFTSRG